MEKLNSALEYLDRKIDMYSKEYSYLVFEAMKLKKCIQFIRGIMVQRFKKHNYLFQFNNGAVMRRHSFDKDREIMCLSGRAVDNYGNVLMRGVKKKYKKGEKISLYATEKTILRMRILFFLLVLFGCSGKNLEVEKLLPEIVDVPLGECLNDNDFDIYELNELYFSKDKPLEFNLQVIYYGNGDIDTSYMGMVFRDRVEKVNSYFEDAKIKFILNTIKFISGKPVDYAEVRKNLFSLEKLIGKERRDMREYFYINHNDFWQGIFGDEKKLNIHVYNDEVSSTAGFAGGIGSIYSAIRLPYNDISLLTWEHELGHQLGLYHTHQYDTSNGLNNSTGDRVCDTPSTPPLLNLIDDSCKLVSNWYLLRKEQERYERYKTVSADTFLNSEKKDVIIRNIMSYTRHQCRDEFTEVQIKRMRKIIETNADLRRTLVGMELGYKERLLKLKEYE